jgi:hypothetical protein
MRPLAALALLPLLGSCSPGEADPTGEASSAATPPPRPTRDVLDATLSELGVSRREGVLSARELRGNRGLMPDELEEAPGAPAQAEEDAVSAAQAPSLDPELVELRDGLVGMVLSDGRCSPPASATPRAPPRT